MSISKKPFGTGIGEAPIRWSHLLSPEPTCSHRDIILQDVALFVRNRSVGLDETESLQGPSPVLGKQEVFYQGIYEPLCKGCLSPDAQQTVNKLLRFRANRNRVQIRQWTSFFPHGRSSALAPLRFMIWGTKAEAASYLTVNDYREHLILANPFSPKHTNRVIVVASLHEDTLKDSRRFLRRYQLVNLIREIAPYRNISIEKRNPNDLISMYSEACKTSLSHRRRFIFSPNGAGEHSREGLIPPEIPRHQDHLSRAQICGLLACEAEWLVAFFLSLASPDFKRLFDVGAWVKFCKVVRKARRNASRNGLRHWGRTTLDAEYSSDADLDLPQEFTKYGGSLKFWRDKLEKELKRKGKARENADQGPSHYSGRVQWDDSDLSSSNASDSDDESAYDDAIPDWMRRRPILSRSGTWVCEGPGCDYGVDINNLGDKELATLDKFPYPLPFIINATSGIHTLDLSGGSVGPDQRRFGGKLRTFMKELQKKIDSEVFIRSREMQFSFQVIVQKHYEDDHGSR